MFGLPWLVACSSGPNSATRPVHGDAQRCDEERERCACGDDEEHETCSEPTPPKTSKDAALGHRLDGSRKDAALGERDAAGPADPATNPPEEAAVGPGVVIPEPADEAARIYDPEVVHTFDLEVAPADLARADMNPASEEYVPARLTFDGMTYDVGYRYKGSLGAFFPPCTNILTRQKEGKCSVKLSFNWKNPEGLFFGLKKLLFHAMNNDRSMLRERLGYALYREMGVPTARASHAVLRVNGKADIYALVEEIDGRFTRSRFSEGGKGNLYKEVWPISKDPQVYSNALETNEDDSPSVERMIRFAEAVMQGPEATASFVDQDVMTSYMAVDRVIISDDGPFHLYCYPMGNNPTAPANHNYFWYEAKKADRLWLIPWDLDYAMAEAENPAHIRHDWRKKPEPAECNACSSGLGSLGGGSLPPACDPLIRNLQTWIAEYDAKVKRFVEGPFRKSAVDQKLSAWKQQLTEAGYPPPEAEVTRLSEILDRARMNSGFKY